MSVFSEANIKNKLVSVVIPNFNGAKFIAEAIDSVLAQTYEKFEIIVVNDGSTDNSLEILELFSDKITVIKSENYGAAHARNLGILHSKGEYISLLDADDFWHIQKLEKQIDLITSSNSDLVYCASNVIDADSHLLNVLRPEFSGDCYEQFKKFPTSAIVVAGCSSSLFRRKILAASGLFNPNVTPPSEDWDFFRRVSRSGKIDFLQEVLVTYRLHGNNISHQSIKTNFNGNKSALNQLICEDDEIKVIGKILLWSRLYFSYFKTFVKGIQRLLFKLP
jgi:glycosyltransferase involved in cell wall biosynthesis